MSSEVNYIKIKDKNRKRIELLRDIIRHFVKIVFMSGINGTEGDYVCFLNYLEADHTAIDEFRELLDVLEEAER